MLTAYTTDRFRPKHFAWSVRDKVATISLNRPERKNPLTFESYAELRDLFRDLVYVDDIRAVVITGEGGNFCSGGDVHDIIGQGRAAELLYTGRSMSGEEGERWGFFNRLYEPDGLPGEAAKMAHDLAHGPTFAHAMTKKTLDHEWNMSVDQAIEAEAQAQAICMQTEDFARAYRAFVAKQKPVFEGN